MWRALGCVVGCGGCGGGVLGRRWLRWLGAIWECFGFWLRGLRRSGRSAAWFLDQLVLELVTKLFEAGLGGGVWAVGGGHGFLLSVI